MGIPSPEPPLLSGQTKWLAYLTIALVLYNDIAFAQKIKVKKSRGLTALIETSVPLEEGQIYELAGSAVAADVDYATTGYKSRKNSISFGGSVLALSNDEYQKTSINLQGRYGWNFSILEIGLLAQYGFEDLGLGATTDIAGGAYIDYNFTSNRDPKTLVYGLIGLASFGSKQLPDSSGGGSVTTTEGNAGVFLTWFMNSSQTALRTEAYIDFQQISTSRKQINVWGGGSRALMVFYF